MQMKIKEIVLGIAIIVLTIFVTYYGINTIFPSPDYNSYCTPEMGGATYTSQSLCETNSGRWNPVVGPKATGQVDGYCDLYYQCNQDFNDANKMRSRKVFFIALPLGVAIIALGAFVFGLEAVGAGLMGGGIGTLIYGSGAYWPYTENWIRFGISLLGLILIIWLAYFFNKRFGKKRKRR